MKKTIVKIGVKSHDTTSFILSCMVFLLTRKNGIPPSSDGVYIRESCMIITCYFIL